MGPRGLGRTCVFEDLLGLHQRVHRRLGFGEARLRTEAAILCATARLGVDQRAHVGGVGETLHARLPRSLDERFDLRVVLDLAEAQRLLAGDQRRHPITRYGPSRTLFPAERYPLRHCGERFSANARTPSRMSFDANDAWRSPISSCSSSAGSSLADPSSAAITRLLPVCASGALPASSSASSSAIASSSAAGQTRFTSPHV